MEHKGTTVITSKRLLLRRFAIEDAEAMFHNWASDPDVCRFLTWPPHPDVNVTRRILQNWITSYAQPNFYQWAIALQEHPHNVIGSISVVAQNEELVLVHIGYCLGKEWWHQHITSEAFTAIIPFLFEEVKANRIETRHDPDNPNSGRVMRSCGLTYEGTAREADRSNRGIVDACNYSLLKKEYPQWLHERGITSTAFR